MNSPKVDEASLYEIWKTHDFCKPLQTINGEEIEILDVGVFNADISGPDFQHARIRVGNLTYIGDVEIDINYHDWKAHAHNINSKYNKVILHISLFNKFKQAYVYTKDGRKVPNATLYDILGKEYFSLLSAKSEPSTKRSISNLKCTHIGIDVDLAIKQKFIAELGVKRFQKKCTRIYNRLKELSFLNSNSVSEPVVNYQLSPEFMNKEFNYEDFKGRELWEQLFYELVFEALGYSQNKSIMLRLAQSVELEVFRNIEKDADYSLKLESILFNIAGIMPDIKKLPQQEVSEYSKKLAEFWEKFSIEYTGISYDETDWHFFRLRPVNFPTIRIAGGVRIINSLINGNLIGTMIKKIVEIRNSEILKNSLRSLFVVKGDGYWQNHYIFDKSTSSRINYFVGATRADEIMVNVVLPFFSVYFEVFGKATSAKKILQLYNTYEQRMENKIIREVSESLELKDFSSKTLYSQGMLELYRNYCSRGKCTECEIGKAVF